MARQDEVLFLKIAVKNKLISADDANRCLRELTDEGTRVGPLLVERQMLEPAQVKQIYALVAKIKASKGGSAPPRRTAAAGTGTVRTRRAARQAPPQPKPLPEGRSSRIRQQLNARRARRVKRVHPALGIGSIAVVFILAVLLIFFMTRGARKVADEPVAEDTSGTATEQPTPSGPSTGGESSKAPPQPAVSEAETARYRSALDTAKTDAAMYASDEQYRRALETYERFREAHAQLPDALRAELEAGIRDIREQQQEFLQAVYEDIADAPDAEKALRLKDILDRVDPETAKDIQARLAKIEGE